MAFVGFQTIPGLPPMRWLAEVVKKVILRPVDPAVDAHLLQNIERLALTAPHVLADLGFERDVHASSPQRTVWRKGRTRVVLTTDAPLVRSVTE